MEVICAKGNCKFQSSQANKYCMKHQLQLLVDSTSELNLKLCVNYIRGCETQLDIDYKFTRCSECLSKDRVKDKERRDKAKLSQETNQTLGGKVCTICCREFPIDSFIGIKSGNLKSCKACREQNRVQDIKRDRGHRNALARVNDQTQERKEVKRKWNEKGSKKLATNVIPDTIWDQEGCIQYSLHEDVTLDVPSPLVPIDLPFGWSTIRANQYPVEGNFSIYSEIKEPVLGRHSEQRNLLTVPITIRRMKRTKQEKNEQARNRNRLCRLRQRDKQGDVEYKKRKAEDIAKYRRIQRERFMITCM